MGEFNSNNHYIYLSGHGSLRRKSSPHSQQMSPKCSTWMQSQKWQNDLCSFPRQTIEFSSVQSLSCVQLFVTPWTTAHQASLCPLPTSGVCSNSCHHIGDAIQPSHPLSSPSLPTFNLSQHENLLQGVSSSHQVAKVLELQLHHKFFQWIFRTDFL